MSIDCVLCLTAWVSCVTVTVMIYHHISSLLPSLLLIAYIGVWILSDRAVKRSLENLARADRRQQPKPVEAPVELHTFSNVNEIRKTAKESARALGKTVPRADWLARLDADVRAGSWSPSPKPRDTERKIPMPGTVDALDAFIDAMTPAEPTVDQKAEIPVGPDSFDDILIERAAVAPSPVDQTAPTEPRMPTGRILEGIPAAPPVTPRRLTTPILDTSTNEPEDLFRLPSRALYEVLVDDKAAVDGIAELSRFETAVDAEEIAALVRRLTPDGMVTIRRIA